jgi:ferredoxin
VKGFHYPSPTLLTIKRGTQLKTILFYYTGTGNSLWTARLLAQKLGNADMIPIHRIAGERDQRNADRVGIIFPVHMWGLPRRVISFISSLTTYSSLYYFAVAVNAGQVAATLLQLQKLMKGKGLLLSSGFQIVMPTNYIPWGGPGPKDKIIKKIVKASEKIKAIADVVEKGDQRPVEKGPFWQNIVFTWLNRLAFPHVPMMDKSFWVDEKCNECGICRTVCPSGNIELKEGRPVWLHHCEQCLACIQWCPQEAIQFGKKTARYERYHHPEVRLSDMCAGSAP